MKECVFGVTHVDKRGVQSWHQLLYLGKVDVAHSIGGISGLPLQRHEAPVFEQGGELTLNNGKAAFNDDPLKNGANIYKEVEGDFVAMARFADMEGLAAKSITPYNEGGLLVSDAQGTYWQLGVFPLYGCGNMLTILSSMGRQQFPNSKGYDFDPVPALRPYQQRWPDMDQHARLAHRGQYAPTQHRHLPDHLQRQHVVGEAARPRRLSIGPLELPRTP